MIRDKHRFHAFMLQNSRYYDTGNKLEYLKTVVDFALAREDIGEDFRRFLQDKLR
jgi:UTP--glucose-1-phosphate uridylyltransferase